MFIFVYVTVVYILFFLRPCGGKSCPCYPLAKGHWAYFLWAFLSGSLFPWCDLIALEQEEKITETYFVTENMFYVKHHYVVCEWVINYSENGLVVVDTIKISKRIISQLVRRDLNTYCNIYQQVKAWAKSAIEPNLDFPFNCSN